MTKKLTFLFATLSLCACSFIGCDDDKGDDSDKATLQEIGGECSYNANCKDSWCKKETGKDKGVCTARLEDGKACTEDTQCEGGYCNDDLCASSQKVVKGDKSIGSACNDNNECESGFCTDYDGNGKKCAHVACSTFSPNCDSSTKTAYKSCDPITGSLESEICQGNNICKTYGKTVKCGPEVEEVTCLNHQDCTDETKPLCNKNHVCVAGPLYSDYCNESNCPSTEGECIKGVCVTPEMKQKAQSQTEETCSATRFVDFCLDDVFVYCNKNQVVKYDCAANNAGHCVVAMNPTDTTEETITVDCSGNDDMINRCGGHSSANLCYADENWYSSFFCVIDLEGNDITLPDYDSIQSDCATACTYDNSGNPTCARSN